MKRIAAILALFALVSPWAPHNHANATTSAHAEHAATHAQDDARPLTVASDDAHHEHSSTPHVDAVACPVCRSNAEREDEPVAAPVFAVFAEKASRSIVNEAPQIPIASAIGQPPTRAPPIA